jgi:alanine racemase
MRTRPTAASEIELSRSALKGNIRFLKKTLGGCRLISVVKSNAYGHGIRCFAPLARELGVNMFGVFSADEAWSLLDAGIPGDEILIMGYIHESDLPWATGNNISFYVSDLECIRAAAAAGNRENPSRIHLELETGMNRTGLPQDSLETAAEILNKEPDAVRVMGTCTHLAGAESTSNHQRIQKQMTLFHELCGFLLQLGITPGMRHAASSAAALSLPETRMEGARVGIALYGYWPSMETRMHHMLDTGRKMENFRDPLKRIISWKSRVMGITMVKPGEFVGYGSSFLTSRCQRVAAVPVGYSQGFSRSLSNLGHVLIQGRRAPVCGVVNMNMMMVDITDCPGAEKGDEVVIIGKQGRREISVRSFGDLAGHLNYEVLALLPESIPRAVTA